MASVAIDDVDTLNGFGNGNNSLCEVDVLPFQGTDLANAHASREAQQYAEVAKVEVLTNKSKQTLLVGNGEDFHFRLLLYGWELDVPFFVHKVVEFNAIAVNHFQDNQQVLHGLATQ